MTISRWAGIVGAPDLLEEHADLILSLVEGYETAEKYHEELWSARINDANRLLFDTIRVDGLPYLAIVKEMLNHDYQKEALVKLPAVTHELIKSYMPHWEQLIRDFIRDAKYAKEYLPFVTKGISVTKKDSILLLTRAETHLIFF